MQVGKVIAWILTPFAWREDHHTYLWSYEENLITGRRRAIQIHPFGNQPVDHAWLAAGTGEPIIIRGWLT